MKLCTALWRHRSTIIFLATPFILLPLPIIVSSQPSYCGYCMLLMGVYWVSEVIPLAITSLIPLILFPMFGIMEADDVSKAYFNDTNWLFVGGLMIAVGIETSNLHKRISLRVLTLVGSRPKSLMFGFMSTTFFLSMWISNTATTAMMLPVVEAVTKELTKNNEQHIETELSKAEENLEEIVEFVSKTENAPVESPPIEPPQTHSEIKRTTPAERRMTNIKKGLAICVPYAASIGGTVTINGTGTNVVLAGSYRRFFPNSNIKLSFGLWMMYTLPSALIFFFCAYLWLSYLYLDLSIFNVTGCFKKRALTKEEERAEEVLKKEYKKLGSLSWSEGMVLMVFVATAFLWLFRDPGFITGWGSWFHDEFVDDGTVAIAMSSLLFFLPSEKPQFLNKSRESSSVPARTVLTWKNVQQLFPWNVVMLLGGGFALAKGAKDSGLSEMLGEQLSVLGNIDSWLVCLIVTILLCLLTELTSNVATATIFIPILVALSQSIEVHPIYLLVPPILATSMAFMLPVATPPNAIAFAYGHLEVSDMVKAGWILNVIGVAIATVSINTYGVGYFNLTEFPDWARRNSSSWLGGIPPA